jgi:hypothetical protein
MNNYDDVYCTDMYTCACCEEKDYLLREAGKEVNQLIATISAMNRLHKQAESNLLDKLEDVCHMLGIPFVGEL